MYMYFVAAFTIILGVGILVFHLLKSRAIPMGNWLAGIIGGLLLTFGGIGIGFLAESAVQAERAQIENDRLASEASERARAEIAAEAAQTPAPTLEIADSEPVSEPEPTPEPVVASTTATPEADIANIAAIDGISADDPALTSAYSRLQELCPPENASIGDMAATMQRLVRERGGRSMSLVEIMRQLAIAQEGGQSAGMKCSETGGMLTELLIQGM